MEHTWNYGGAEYDCDICDCECYELLSSALVKLCEEMAGIDYSGQADENNEFRLSAGEKLKKNCEVIDRFFDALFGEEKRRQICGERLNLINHSSALASFLCYIETEISLLAQSGEEIKRRLCGRLSLIND